MKEHKSISIADQVFEQLERDILSGKYPRGTVLSEPKLSAELGVSRTPIREALRRLEQENILEVTGRSAVVVGITKDDMRDMYNIRIQIEGPAAARAAQNISDEALREMRELVDLQRFWAERPGDSSSAQIRNLDSRFHELLYRSCGSRAYCEVLLSLHKKITKFRMASVSQRSRALESVEEHEAILAALSLHDAKAASQAALAHTVNARDRMEQMAF